MKAIDVDKIDWQDGCFFDKSSGKPIPIHHKIATIEMLRDWQDSCENELKLQGARDFAEWLANGNTFIRRIGSEEMKTIDELLSEWQKETANKPKDMDEVLGFDAKEALSEYEKMLNSPIGKIIKDL